MFRFFVRVFEITSVSFCIPPSASKKWAEGVELCTRVTIIAQVILIARLWIEYYVNPFFRFGS